MLRIGRIAYANCTPIFHTLQKHVPCNDYEFITGVPATLNAMLRTGTIDVCPSSSIAYARNPELYYIFPNLSISSNGAVQSVLLFSDRPIEMLDGCTIRLSAESATSVNLLRLLMKDYIGCNCSYTVDTPVTTSPAAGSPLLLIGDAALKTSLSASSGYVYDLGTLWRDWTGLPFVFALWFCTRAACKKHWRELCKLNENLVQAKLAAPSEYEEIAATSPDAEWMGAERLTAYWRNNISYDLNAEHLQGLQLFYEKLYQERLIPDVPNLAFFSTSYDTHAY